MKTNFVSLKTIMDRLLRKEYLKSITYEEVIDLTVDFLELVGVPDIFEEVLYSGSFNNFKVDLPCELTEEIVVFVNGHPAYAASNMKHDHLDKIGHNYNRGYENDFKVRNKRGRPLPMRVGSYTYKIKENTLYLNIPSGRVSLIGSKVKVDENGEVMIPDDRLFLLALEYYVIYKKQEDRYFVGQVPKQMLDTAEQEYMWNVGKLEASHKMMNYAEAATVFNTLHTLRNKPFDYSNSFSTLPSGEVLKIH